MAKYIKHWFSNTRQQATQDRDLATSQWRHRRRMPRGVAVAATAEGRAWESQGGQTLWAEQKHHAEQKPLQSNRQWMDSSETDW